MRIVFMGTSRFARIILDALVDSCKHEVAAIYTKEYKRSSGKTIESTVGQKGRQQEIPVENPDYIDEEYDLNLLKSFDADVFCVAAYGMILPKVILEIPKYGCLNVHASLLPKWRGAAPIQRAILSGDEWTGVSIMKMKKGLDTGPFCKQEEVRSWSKYLDSLEKELAEIGSIKLLEALDELEQGKLIFYVQDSKMASYAEKIEPKELFPMLYDTNFKAYDKVRASNTYNPARCKLAGREVRLEKIKLVFEEDSERLTESFPDLERAGALVFFQKRLFMGFKNGWLELENLSPAGKKSMDAKAFAAGIQGIKKAPSKWNEIA
ncbi:MAG: methionyl-tRNA formyltransferase [Eggerthellaceae bacterium]|nr:methionyl-tRNA formyltransferase [Eggerthellaceae bacterium]